VKKVFKYRKKLRLIQGQSYLFKFHKKVISPDRSEYFVVIGPFGDKHLIPSEYYSFYKLELGKSYLCRVDKINCLGRIFMEPPHPYYKENNSYLFEYFEQIQEIQKSGDLYNQYRFRGKYSDNAFLDRKHTKLPDKLKFGFHSFKIQKISKGRVYLEH